MTPAHSRSAPLLAFWRTYGLALLLAFASLLAVRPAHAQLRVDISGTGATQYRWPSPISPWTMPTVAPWPR